MFNPFEHYISVSTCSGMMCIACKKSKKMRKIHKITFYLFSEIHTISFPKLLVSKFLKNIRVRVGIFYVLVYQNISAFPSFSYYDGNQG